MFGSDGSAGRSVFGMAGSARWRNNVPLSHRIFRGQIAFGAAVLGVWRGLGAVSMRARGRLGIGGCGVVLAALLVGSAHAAGGETTAAPSARKAQPAKKRAPPVTVNVPALTEKLKSTDPAQVGAALAEAKAAGKGAGPVAPAVE